MQCNAMQCIAQRPPAEPFGRRRQLFHIHPETQWPSCGSLWWASAGASDCHPRKPSGPPPDPFGRPRVGSCFTSTPRPNGHPADPRGGRRRARPIATSGNPDWASRGAHRQASAAVSHPPRDPMAILRIPVDCRPRTPSGLPADPFGKQRQRFHIHRTADGNPVGFLRIPSAGVGNCVTSTSRPIGQPANPRAGRRWARPIATHEDPQAVRRSPSAGVGSCRTSTPRPHGNPADPRGRRRRARPIATHGNPVGFLRTLSAGVASCFTSTPRPNCHPADPRGGRRRARSMATRGTSAGVLRTPSAGVGYRTVLHCIALCCDVVHCVVLQCVASHFVIFKNTKPSTAGDTVVLKRMLEFLRNHIR